MINSYNWNHLKSDFDIFKTKCYSSHEDKLNQLFEPDENNEAHFLFKKIESKSDLDELSNTQGFYVIFTDCKYDDNTCSLDVSFEIEENNVIETKAIYRGEGYHVKERLISHLFNSQHKISDDKQMENCMQIEVGVKGIDIDSDNYKNFNWFVSVIRVAKSYSIVRKIMEEVFDAKYGRPLASREKKKQRIVRS